MAVIYSLKCTVYVVPLAVVCCHSLSFVVTRCHSLFLVIVLCNSLYHSLLLVAIRCTIGCHHCTTRYHSLSLFAILCQSLYHSLSLDVPLACLFINDFYLKSFCKNKKITNLQIVNNSDKKMGCLRWYHVFVR